MINIPGVSPLIMWGSFIFLIVIFLFMDLGIFNRKKHTLSIKEALIWSGVWFTLSMIFNYFIWLQWGEEIGLQFLTGYLLEKSLSVDNLFVILLVFLSFKIPQDYQHKILFWGIVGALFLRGIMIGIGGALISKFEWIMYLFGAFLIYGGIKIFFKDEEDFDPHDSFTVKLIKKFVHVTKNNPNGKFVLKENGKWVVTTFFVALIIIEITDIAFAFDSIPAIFGITKEPFIVFTSNIFAILGLRSLYFVILKAHAYFAHINYGLGIILIFIGVKMFAESWIHIPVFLSLGIVLGILISTIMSSIFFAKEHKHKISGNLK